MPSFKLVEELSCRPGATTRYVVQALSNPLIGVGAGSDVEKALIGLRVLYDGGGFAVNCEHHRAFGLLELLHEVAGRPPKRSQGLNVICDVEHMYLCFEHL
jgi:hypothetical protein